MAEPEVIDVAKMAKEEFQQKTINLFTEVMSLLSDRTAKAKVNPDPEVLAEEATIQGVVCSALMVQSTMRFSDQEVSQLQSMGVTLVDQILAAAEQQAMQTKLS